MTMSCVLLVDCAVLPAAWTAGATYSEPGDANDDPTNDMYGLNTIRAYRPNQYL